MISLETQLPTELFHLKYPKSLHLFPRRTSTIYVTKGRKHLERASFERFMFQRLIDVEGVAKALHVNNFCCRNSLDYGH